jgi:hypothetical protein
MPHSQYSHAHKARVAAGEVKSKGDNNSMVIEGANVVDESGPLMPKATPAPRSPIPQDDVFHKYRTEQT